MSTPPNGHRAVAPSGGALRAIPDPPPAAVRTSNRGRRLQDGMAIAADVDARVLGMHLLALHADVLVTPARIAIAVGPARARADAAADASGDGTVVVTRERRRRLARAAPAPGATGAPRAPALATGTGDGSPPGAATRRRTVLARRPAGDGLAAATRALESGAGELRRARERMP